MSADVRSSRVDRRVTQVLGIVMGLVAGVFVGMPEAQAAGYYGPDGAAYASRYACNRDTSCRNTFYHAFGNDCTNFVSQALFEGGMDMRATDGDSNTVWWYDSMSGSSLSWRTVDYFRKFMVGYSHRASYVSVSMGSAYTPASRGDVYVYDWGKGNGYSHVSMATNWGSFISFYDSVAKKNYNQVTGGAGDKMAQHTTDRDGAPWNWGYQTERDPLVRSKMRTVLMDFTH